MEQTEASRRYRAARDLLLSARTDYPRATAQFSWPRFDGPFNWATDWFDVVARGSQRTALWIVEEGGTQCRYSYDELAARSDRVATWMAGLGVGKGDPVLLMLGNQIELWESMLAVMKLGAVLMPTTTAIGAADLADRVERGSARVVIANAADAPKFASVPGEYIRIAVGEPVPGWYGFAEAENVTEARTFGAVTEPDDPLLYYFTSGTTSKPKLVEHSQVSYPVGHLSTLYWVGAQPGDVHLNISSPGWAKHAWSSFFVPLIAEATIFVYNYARFDPAALLDAIRTARVTTLCAPPTVWRMLIKADLSGGPGALREVLSAGEPLNPEVIEQVREQWGLTLRDGFGQTETTAQVGNTPGSPVRPGSMGKPLPGAPITLVDPATGKPSQTEGEVCVDLGANPLALMTGYCDDPERQAEATAGGYYHTGDVASIDAEGTITYIGRTDDVFKASDYKVSPFELESVLIEHPAVAEAAVVPAPDELRLAVPKAYIALAAGWESGPDAAAAILRHAREHLAPYLRVRRVEFFDLPKTISGKIRRVELREREQQANGQLAGQFTEADFPELRS